MLIGGTDLTQRAQACTLQLHPLHLYSKVKTVFHFPKVNHLNTKKKVKLVHGSDIQLVSSVTNYNLTNV